VRAWAKQAAWAATVCLASAAAPAEDLREQALAAMRKGAAYFRSISTHGGYLWDYSADLTERWGEGRATETQVWVQPPGTPAVGEAYLRAHRATGERAFLAAATDAARALAWGQLDNGGWGYKIDFRSVRLPHGEAPDPARTPPPRPRGAATFDDDTTQSALRFLMRVERATRDEALAEAVRRGLKLMLDAQFDNGAWPQRWPLSRGHYSSYYTFNDAAINDCVRVMMQAHEAYGDERFGQSVRKAGQFIAASRGRPPQAGWGQQYSHDLAIAWARDFEPPGYCSAVTARNILTLIDICLCTGDEKFLDPIAEAAAWLERSRLADGTWARFYEPKTNRPYFCDRGRRILYDVERLGPERRHGYAWLGDFGVSKALVAWAELGRLGRQAYAARRDRAMTAAERQQRLRGLEPRVREAIAAQDGQGRWVVLGPSQVRGEDGRRIEREQVRSRDFIANLAVLCEYVELTGAPEAPPASRPAD